MAGGEHSEPGRIRLQGPGRDLNAEPAATAQRLQRRAGAASGGCAAPLRSRPGVEGRGHLRQRPRLFQRCRCAPASAALPDVQNGARITIQRPETDAICSRRGGRLVQWTAGRRRSRRDSRLIVKTSPRFTVNWPALASSILEDPGPVFTKSVLILGPQVSRFRTAWARSAKGQEERFPPTRLSAGCGFRKETIVGMRRNGRDAPKAAVCGSQVINTGRGIWPASDATPVC